MADAAPHSVKPVGVTEEGAKDELALVAFLLLDIFSTPFPSLNTTITASVGSGRKEKLETIIPIVVNAISINDW